MGDCISYLFNGLNPDAPAGSLFSVIVLVRVALRRVLERLLLSKGLNPGARLPKPS